MHQPDGRGRCSRTASKQPARRNRNAGGGVLPGILQHATQLTTTSMP